MERTPFGSGTILSAGWEPNAAVPNLGVLEIEFSSLARYQYRGVPKRIWDEFKQVGDKGNYFVQMIRGQFDFACVHKEPVLKFGGKNASRKEKKQRKASSKKANAGHHSAESATARGTESEREG